jgi:light-regulated signal transduction histidine kinase (bacteriophytochrome)
MSYTVPSPAQTEIESLRQEIERLKQQLAERDQSESSLRAEFEQRVQERTAALRRSVEDLQQFAYVSSHDLQEPLRTILSYTRLIESRYKDQLDTSAHEFLEFIADAAARMNTLVHDLLIYSRVANADEVAMRPVDTTGVVAALQLQLAKDVHETASAIAAGALPTVLGDERQITLLFQNILANAMKYRSAQPPQVLISAEDQGEVWQFSIRDNGIGIDPAYHERIFGLFKRLHGREVPGTGLGLAICRKIVEKHGGRIWVESEIGRGSTFHFTLPA